MLCFEKEISKKDSSYIYERESNCPEDRLASFPPKKRVKLDKGSRTYAVCTQSTEDKNKNSGLETVRVFSLKWIVERVLFG